MGLPYQHDAPIGRPNVALSKHACLSGKAHVRTLFLPISCFSALSLAIISLPSAIFSSCWSLFVAVERRWSSFERVETMLVMITGHLGHQSSCSHQYVGQVVAYRLTTVV
jgi:hypothetical protein